MSEQKKYKVGYVAGVFDLFHIGHLNLIRNAKELCELLIVGVLTDELTCHFKKNPPIIPETERLSIIAALRDVDQAVLVDSGTIDKRAAWDRYHFDCLFSGNDWENHPSWVRDRQRLREVGSDIHFFRYTQSTSSTRIKALLGDREDASQKLLIYGAGEYGQRALSYYGESNVLGFIDRDPEKIGTLLRGKPILSMERIKDQLDDKYTIIIALKKGKEAVQDQLRALTTAQMKNYI